MKKSTLLYLFLFLGISFLAKAQVTLIPDQNFEQRLIDLKIDSDGIINGQILTSDALVVTSLSIGTSGITGLIGLDAFINLETLNCYYTPINGYTGYTGVINVSTMPSLKELDVTAANLGTIDVSNNTLLEKIKIGNEYNIYDVPILNGIEKLDLSNNPNVKYVDAFNLFTLKRINMRNNTADVVVVKLGNNLNYPYNVCIEVDDPLKAKYGAAPYDAWAVIGNHFFSDNCTLSIEKFVNENFKIYPSPATEYVTIEQKQTNGVTLQAVQILDSSGKWVRSVKEHFNHIDVSNLSKGMYLFVIQTNKGNKTEKILIK